MPPPMPDSAPEMTMDSTMLRLELMPAYWAASRLRPQAFSS